MSNGGTVIIRLPLPSRPTTLPAAAFLYRHSAVAVSLVAGSRANIPGQATTLERLLERQLGQPGDARSVVKLDVPTEEDLVRWSGTSSAFSPAKTLRLRVLAPRRCLGLAAA